MKKTKKADSVYKATLKSVGRTYRSEGKTLEEAKAMAIDAIQGYIASLRKHDDPIPSDQGSLISAVEVEAKQSTAHA